MTDLVLKVDKVSKYYRLGEVGTGTISHDLNRWWSRIRGKEDPFSEVGSINDRTKSSKKGEIVCALQNISCELRKGEVVGVIGRNGAGKSTLLKILSRVTAPSEGTVKVRGRIASLLEVGTGMHPEMTGRENIYLNGTILGMTKREISSKFDEIIDFAGCSKYVDTPFKRYSSGMKVRLGFAVAAFLEPEILIVDEVLAVGDFEFQKKAIGKIKEVSSESGRSVLFVSHNMGSIRTLCDKGLLLENGTVAAQGPINSVIDHYLSSSEGVLTKTKLNDDDIIKVDEVFLTQQGNRKAELIDTMNDTEINIIYRITESISPLRIKMQLRHAGQIIFHTDDTIGNFQRERKNEGKFHLNFRIPKLLLSNIDYELFVGADIPGLKILIPFTHVLNLNVVDSSGKFKYSRNWPGVIKPVLDISEMEIS